MRTTAELLKEVREVLSLATIARELFPEKNIKTIYGKLDGYPKFRDLNVDERKCLGEYLGRLGDKMKAIGEELEGK